MRRLALGHRAGSATIAAGLLAASALLLAIDGATPAAAQAGAGDVPAIEIPVRNVRRHTMPRGTSATAPESRNPIIVYTSDAAALRAGGPAEQLLQRAREQRQVRVIVGLRTIMRMEHTLSQTQVESQRQALRRLQDAVAVRVLGSRAARGIDRFDFIPYMSLFVNAGQLGRLLADPRVVSIQEDVPVPPALSESVPLIHAPDVWAEKFKGNGYVVAVLDSGVDKTHRMFSGNKVVSEACYSTTNAAKGFSSVCPGGVDESTAPGSGVNCPVAVNGCDHGTFVASIAVGSASAAGLEGVARSAKLIAVQVVSRDSANNTVVSFQSDQIKGLRQVYALRDDYKIAAVNMSLGSGGFAAECDAQFPALTTAINNLRAVGIATTIGSGNGGATGKISRPACISTAIAVGNTRKDDLLWRTSDHSALVPRHSDYDSLDVSG